MLFFPGTNFLGLYSKSDSRINFNSQALVRIVANKIGIRLDILILFLSTLTGNHPRHHIYLTYNTYKVIFNVVNLSSFLSFIGNFCPTQFSYISFKSYQFGQTKSGKKLIHFQVLSKVSLLVFPTRYKMYTKMTFNPSCWNALCCKIY